MLTPIACSSITRRWTVTWPWRCCISTKRRSSGPKWPRRPPGSELPAGLGQTREGVAAVAAAVAVRATADLTLGHLTADVVFRAVGVQGDFGAVEHHQQLELVGVQPLEQSIKYGKAGAAAEDAIKTRSQLAPPAGRRVELVGLQVGIEPPDQLTHILLGGSLLVGDCLQLVHQALGMDPTQRVLADVELPGVITEHDRLAQEPVCRDRPP